MRVTVQMRRHLDLVSGDGCSTSPAGITVAAAAAAAATAATKPAELYI